MILLKGNALFVIEFAYYNIAHSKIRSSRFIHNKGPAMSYKTWSVARRHETWNVESSKVKMPVLESVTRLLQRYFGLTNRLHYGARTVCT